MMRLIAGLLLALLAAPHAAHAQGAIGLTWPCGTSNQRVATTKMVTDCGAGAWISFSAASPTVKGSYNATLAKNGTGDFTITFTAPFASASYMAVCKTGTPGGAFGATQAAAGGRLAGSYRMVTKLTDFTTAADFTDNDCMFFR